MQGNATPAKAALKVLVLASTYPRYPRDTLPPFVHELCRRLPACDIHPEVLTPHLPSAAEQEMLDGVSVRRFRYAPSSLEVIAGEGGIISRLRHQPLRALALPSFLLVYLWQTIRMVKNGRYDVVHAHWLIPGGLIAALASCVLGTRFPPLILTSHGGDLFALRGRIYATLRRWVAAKASHITLVSKFMQETLQRESAIKTPTSVLSMGVDLTGMFKPVDGVQRLPHRLVFVGRLVEKKGAHILIRALALLRTEFPALELVIVGDGPERGKLTTLAQSLGVTSQIEFLGARPQADLPALYSSASIAVIPSIIDALGDQEGLGLVTVEAIGCGCVAIASDLAAIREVIEDGVDGLLFEAGNPQALAERIKIGLNNSTLCSAVVTHARDNAMRRFDWPNIADQYASLLGQMAEAPRPH